jgi:hypothetical protein
VCEHLTVQVLGQVAQQVAEELQRSES